MKYRIEELEELPRPEDGRASLSRVVLEHRAVLWKRRGRKTSTVLAILHPGSELEEKCPLREAEELYLEWHDFPPDTVALERKRTSEILISLGRAVGIAYESDKWTGRPTLYVHEFKGNAQLRADPRNPGTLIIRGPFRVRAEGIVG